MAKLTITIDDEILCRARVRAREQNTSVTALIREYLLAFAATGASSKQASDAIVRLSFQARSGRGHHRWTRDETHERR